MKSTIAIGVSTLALGAVLAASVASAQTLGSRTSVADDLNEDLIEDIEDDAERDLDRFGNEGRVEGFSGSVALRGIAQSGNSESLNFGLGADLNYVWGPNGIEFELNYAYSDDTDDDDRHDEALFYGLEYTRDFNPVTFGFAKLQGSYDDATDADFETDTFLSVGAGYRIFNEPGLQWSVQAGPGYRFAELSDVTDGDFNEWGFGISSDYAHQLSSNLFLTNDTDVIWSESDTVVINDLALSVAMTDALALRTSIITEYHTDPIDAKSTDNTYGVSIVYSFN